MEDDMADKLGAISLSSYVIGLCRQFKLFPNEKTTLLTRNEEMQILQYCLAIHNKKVGANFAASPKICEKILSESMNKRILNLVAGVRSKMFGDKDLKSKSSSSGLVTKAKDSHPENNVLNEASSTTDCIDKNISKVSTGKDESEDEMNDHKDEMKDCSNTKERQAGEVDKDHAPVMLLYLEHLKASNHLMLFDVFEKFLSEVVAESSLHSFVQSDFKVKKDMKISEHSSLPDVEILTLNVLRRIAGMDQLEDDKIMNSQTLKSAQERQHEECLNDRSVSVMPQLASPSVQKVGSLQSQRTKAVSTPVQVFKSKNQLFSPLPSTPITPNTDTERQQVQKRFIENIFRCYLHLLVNTRCELALAFIFNIPDRELDHEAFTHLKHASAESGLSMYQTMSSMLMRVRLGGHGYAPPLDSPLRSYLKGLGSLFDFVDKLQTVIEESVSSRSGCKRVVGILKRSISTCKSRRFPSAAVEAVANALWEVLDDIMSEMEKSSKEGITETLERQDCVIGQESIDAFRKYLDQTCTDVSDVDHYMLGDVRFSQDTPTRFPCLLSKFQSPLATLDEEQEDLDEKSPVTKSEIIRPPVSKVSEALYLDEGDAEDNMVCTPLDLDNVYIIPSKTIVHPKCGADYGPISEELFSPQNKVITKMKDQKKRVPQKRKKKTDVVESVGANGNKDFDENSPRPRSKKDCDGIGNKNISTGGEVDKKSDTNKKQNKTCRRKLLNQIKGQSKITGFFKS